MNIEFLIHGTLSDGQSFWKETDSDYCSLFYVSNRQENVVMDIEVLKRGGGVCTYYNYLRYNNISASHRAGSYFGMTVRVDGSICTDVKSMYAILDTLFYKMVVGSLLEPDGNGFVYTFDSFSTKKNVLLNIQNQFIKMFEATFISNNDFKDIPNSYKKGDSVRRVNINDINKSIVSETLSQGNKLCVSSVYKTVAETDADKCVEKAKTDANARIKAAEEKMQREIENTNRRAQSEIEKQVSSIQKQMSETENSRKNLKQRIERLTIELKDAKESLKKKEEECKQLSQDKLSREISAHIVEIKPSLTKWLSHVEERSTSGQAQKPALKRSGNKTVEIPKWIHVLNCVLLLLILALLIWPTPTQQIQQIDPQQLKEVIQEVRTNEQPQEGIAPIGKEKRGIFNKFAHPKH
ncbi:MAG: hypothetical protein IKX36_08645 [Prevotella sp.]|nr:hypothetical protein [Prevotella sp.]